MKIIRKSKEIKLIFEDEDKKKTLKKMVDICKNWDATAIEIKF